MPNDPVPPAPDTSRVSMSDLPAATGSDPGTLAAADALSSQDPSTEAAPSLPPTGRAGIFSGRSRFLHVGERIADFELVRVLGQGSFGQVFLARQLSLDREVALKVTANRGSEARTLARLEHDHIVQVFTEVVDSARDLRLLCMQYVPGTTLAQVLRVLKERSRSRWSGLAILEAIDELTSYPAPFHPAALRDRDLLARADFLQAVCWLGARLAEALDYAHSRKVLHRDIKPANILLNHYGRPFLADFNLAHSSRPTTGAGPQLFGGTLAYMAPEHLDAFGPLGDAAEHVVDERSDIYALGLVLFEALTGRRPFPESQAEDDWQAALRSMAAARRAGAPSLRLFDRNIPEFLDRTLRRCLDPDPALRYQTAKDLARALDGCRELRRIECELPAGGLLTRAVCAHPFAMLLVLTFLPHILGSLLNISYNALQIVGGLTPAQQAVFARTVLGYNLVVYPVCLVILYRLVAPVWRVASRLARGEPVAREEVDAARQRALTWPRWAVGLSCLGWLPGGILFPTVLALAAGPVGAAVFGHFLLSFTLSGLIALTYSFFGVQLVVLRGLYPRLWVAGEDVAETIRLELGPLERRLWLFQLLAGIIPLAGAVLMVAVGPEVSGYRTFRLLVTGLIVLGMAGFGLALLVNNLLFRTMNVLTRTGGRPENWSAYLRPQERG